MVESSGFEDRESQITRTALRKRISIAGPLLAAQSKRPGTLDILSSAGGPPVRGAHRRPAY